MALRLCASFFSAAESPAASSGASDAKQRQALAAEILLDAGGAAYEKEFRVHFDGSRATGLGFQPRTAAPCRFARRHSTASFGGAAAAGACDAAADAQGADDDYACVVREVAPDGLAAEHNARCRSLGDYSRLIVPGLRVRKVNGADVAGAAYDRVLQQLRAAAPVFFVTFADVRSRRVRLDAPSGSRLRESASAAAAAVPTGARFERRNSSAGVPFAPDAPDAPRVIRLLARRSSASSIVLLHSGAGANGSGDAALASDLEAKAREASERETQQLVQERDAVAAAKLALEADRLRLREERDAVAASHKLLASQRESASDELVAAAEHERREAGRLRAELTAARAALAQLQHQLDQRAGAESELERRLAHQIRSCDELAQRVAELRHEKEELQLAGNELRLELADATQHVEELHGRLVQTQSQQREAEQQLARAGEELACKALQLSDLTQGIQAIVAGGSSHLDRPPQLQAAPAAQQQQLASLRQVQDERRAIEKHRDELLLEASRCEHLLHSSQLEVEELAASNAALRNEIAALRTELNDAQRQLNDHRLRFESQLRVTLTHDELSQQIRELQTLCAAERDEKQQLRAALDALEARARAELVAHVRDQELLARFKQQLANGVVVTKHGARGSPHTRVVFADLACRWISWKPPVAGVSLASPRADAKVETRDLVEVLAGAATEVFQRHRPEAPAKCLSLVFVHPCRTLDIEAESADTCQQLLRGFRLLRDDVASKRAQES